MKKITLFAVAAMAVLSLASCKKAHTCTCTTDIGGGTNATTIYAAKSTKKDAAAWCTGSTSVTTPSSGSTSKTTCVVG
jgi:hypothetical protein